MGKAKTVHFMEDNEMAVVTDRKVILIDTKTGKKTKVSKSQLFDFTIFGLVGGTGLEPVSLPCNLLRFLINFIVTLGLMPC